MRAIRLATFILLLGAATVSWAAEPGKALSLKELVAEARVGFLGMCERQRENAQSFGAKPTDPPVAMALAMNCECMPAQIDKLLASDAVKGEGTTQDAMKLVAPLQQTCGAIVLRKFASQGCETSTKQPEGIKDLPAFCRCLSSGLAKASDDELVADSIAAYRNFEAIVQARKAGTPEPPKHKGVMASIEASCTAAQASSAG